MSEGIRHARTDGFMGLLPFAALSASYPEFGAPDYDVHVAITVFAVPYPTIDGMHVVP